MKIIQRKISELIPADYNPRKITDKEMQDLTDSINKFGIQEPALINITKSRKNIIISGHQRIKAAKSMGKKIFPCIELNLTKAKERELNIRMNKNTGSFSMELLNEFFSEIELIEWGFEDWEFLNIGWDPPKTDEAKNGDNINELTGYNLSSFWKDIKNSNASAYEYQIELPQQNISKNLVRQKYSRTNLEEIERIIRTYMRKGDFFLENCCGWSTFGSSAKHWGYSGIGVDIWDVAINHSVKQIKNIKNPNADVEIKEMDAMKLTFNDNKFDYVYCNPPFMDQEKYSGKENDIAEKDFNKFSNKFINLMNENYRVLKPGGLCTITINDKREKSYLIPIQKYVIEWSEKARFKLWDFVIAEVISQKMRLRKKDYERKRTVKCHEYIITFKKI